MSKKKKYRKLKPTVPNYWWYAITDGCWFCDNKNGCGNCKAAKKFIADKDKRKRKKEKKQYDLYE